MLYDDNGQELFTANKLSTILHQSQAIIGFLKGQLPIAMIEKPSESIITISAHAASQFFKIRNSINISYGGTCSSNKGE